VADTAAGPSKLSCPVVPSVKEYFAPLTSDLCVLPESVLRRQTKNPIKNPITIAAPMPPTTPPINAPLLLDVGPPGKVGVVATAWFGTATATGGFVDGLTGAFIGDKVGDGPVVFITTVGEGVTGAFVTGTGAADTYRV
jgi:hypothetical protein